MPIEIFNDQEKNFNLDEIKKMLENVLKYEDENGMINLIFVNIDEITALNTYRKQDGPTDVLSFNYDDKFLKGEIYVCPEYVTENARHFEVPFNQELLRVCIHGILHICGYDHEKNEEDAKLMFKKQEDYLSSFSDSFDKIS